LVSGRNSMVATLSTPEKCATIRRGIEIEEPES
jgi:hypothetical protein